MNEFNDTEQLIANVRVLPNEQPGELFEMTVAINPAVRGDRYGRATDAGRNEQNGSKPARGVPHSIECEHQQERGNDSERRGEDGLGHLDPPHAPAEFVELHAQRFR
jgi:hypothetical protein